MLILVTFCPEQSLHHLHSFGRQGDGADVGQGPAQNVKGGQKTNSQIDKQSKNGKADQKNEDRQFVRVDIRLTLLNERAPGNQSAFRLSLRSRHLTIEN